VAAGASVTSPQPDQQDEQHTAEEAAVIAALVVFFASVAAVKATLLPARLVDKLVALGLEPRAVRAAGRLAMAPPLTGRGRYGSPTRTTGPATTTLRTVKAEEPLMRARYVLAASKRLTRALLLNDRQAKQEPKSTSSGDEATPKSKVDLFVTAVRQEKVYLDQHRQAGQNRARAAAALDKAAAEAGPNGKLRWTTHPEKGDVTPDCEELEGRLFTLDNLIVVQTENGPMEARPGMMHPHCHCTGDPVGGFNAAAPTVS